VFTGVSVNDAEFKVNKALNDPGLVIFVLRDDEIIKTGKSGVV
jgi:hypothetical protein